MQVEKRDGAIERKILISLITDRTVLGRVAMRWQKEGLFRSRWSNLIAGWCVRYFGQYDKPPGQAIEGMFEQWAETAKEKDTVKLVEKFLAGLSGEYEKDPETNSDYIIDLAGQHFDTVRLVRLAETITADVAQGDLEKARKRVSTWDKVELGVGAGVDVLHDKEAIRKAFEDKKDPLVVYPGALGNFFKDSLERDAFIGFMGPEKRGKTWWLLDLAWRAMCQRRRVAFFEVGDLSQGQILRRFMARAAGRPLKPKKVLYPKYIEHNPDALVSSVDFEEREFAKALTWQKAWSGCQKVLKSKVKSKDSYLKLSIHPNNSISILGIKSIVQGWVRSGWVPDVIIIDYADILAPVFSGPDSRDQINATWMGMRALSQELHCLLVTATQADAASYRAPTMGMDNYSNDKRKYAHVTGMVGINATEEEKGLGLQRLNWVVLRESEFTEGKCVHVAGCLALANPAVKSTF